jgi:hypothetical protein
MGMRNETRRDRRGQWMRRGAGPWWSSLWRESLKCGATSAQWPHALDSSNQAFQCLLTEVQIYLENTFGICLELQKSKEKTKKREKDMYVLQQIAVPSLARSSRSHLNHCPTNNELLS